MFFFRVKTILESRRFQLIHIYASRAFEFPGMDINQLERRVFVRYFLIR